LGLILQIIFGLILQTMLDLISQIMLDLLHNNTGLTLLIMLDLMLERML
jgi:hypothetical protein